MFGSTSNSDEIVIEGKESKMLPVTETVINEADLIRKSYQRDKQQFDTHIVKDEEWWRMRHWDVLLEEDGKERDLHKIEPRSAWLFNSVMNKHADFMDSMPTFAVLPREEGDTKSAELLSQVLPVVFAQSGLEKVYDKNSLAKCKHGTAIYGVFWDGSRRGGLGDISIEAVDALNLVWEPGIEDIQDSANVFYLQTVNKELAKEMFPVLKENESRLSRSDDAVQYRSEDNIDKSDKVTIVDWYYKKNGFLHLCKYCSGVLIAATENEPEKYPNGLYKHGKYPFHIDVMWPIKTSCGGFGIIDIEMSAQEQIDRMSNSVINNAAVSSRLKTYISRSAGINKKDVTDPDVDIVEFDGSLDDAHYKTSQAQALPSIYLEIIASKINELRETSGNNDVNSGNVPSGVTAASAIAALQEQAGKSSRDAIKATYRVFAEITQMVIELIIEFYNQPRIFRIVGNDGKPEFVSFSNSEIKARPAVSLDGGAVDIDPVYDIQVSAQKASPYSSMAQNELALQLYNAGIFDPQRADMALAAVEMMDFKDKDKVIQKIQKNGTMYQMIGVLTERLAKAERMLGIGQNNLASPSLPNGEAEIPHQDNMGVVKKESGVTAKARKESAESTAPR